MLNPNITILIKFQHNVSNLDKDSTLRIQNFIDDSKQDPILPYIPKLDKSQISRKIKKWQMYPKETKNMSKNLTRALKHFYNLETHFSESNCLQNPEIKKFLATKPEDACKQTLTSSLNSCKELKQISKIFFGQLSWSTAFLEHNKVEIEQYIRFNNLWFPQKKN